MVDAFTGDLWYEYNNDLNGEHEVYTSLSYDLNDSLNTYGSLGCDDLAAFSDSIGYGLGCTYTLGSVSYTADLSGTSTSSAELALGVGLSF